MFEIKVCGGCQKEFEAITEGCSFCGRIGGHFTKVDSSPIPSASVAPPTLHYDEQGRVITAEEFKRHTLSKAPGSRTSAAEQLIINAENDRKHVQQQQAMKSHVDDPFSYNMHRNALQVVAPKDELSSSAGSVVCCGNCRTPFSGGSSGQCPICKRLGGHHAIDQQSPDSVPASGYAYTPTPFSKLIQSANSFDADPDLAKLRIVARVDSEPARSHFPPEVVTELPTQPQQKVFSDLAAPERFTDRTQKPTNTELGFEWKWSDADGEWLLRFQGQVL